MSDRVAKRKALRVDGVFDIETEAWDKFVVGGLRYHGETRLFSHHEEDDYIDALLACEGVLHAHNGGRFDALHLIEHIARRGLRSDVALAGACVVSIRIGPLTIRDSARIVPMSLDKFARMFGFAKAPTDLPCICSDEDKRRRTERGQDVSCGGYCSISRTMSPDLYRRLCTYLEKDLTVLEDSLHALETYAERFDLDIAGTIGASAWASAMRRCGLESAEWERRAERDYWFARDGYYGGRVSVFRTAAPVWHSYDLNSAYPAALRDLSLPCEGRRSVDRGGNLYARGYDGIVAARVDIPVSFGPPLPVRVPGPRIAYPTGRVSGIWAANELRHAEKCGVRIERVGRGVFWDLSRRLFPDFINRVYQLRSDAFGAHTRHCKPDCNGKKHPLATWLKLYANSLTGKFAQSPLREALATGQYEEIFCRRPRFCDGELCDHSKLCCEHVCKHTCGAWKPLGRGNLVFSRPVQSFAPSSHVQYAAYLTAHTRIALHAQIEGDACYTDTDCIKRLYPTTKNVGKDLGQWNYEGKRRGLALAPKTYAEWDEDGNLSAKSKGIRNATENWDDIVAGRIVTIDRGVEGLKTALREGRTFVRRHLDRAFRHDPVWVGDRIRLPNHLTRAATIAECLARRPRPAD